MDNQYDKLKKILREMFQMDQADLDFGIYRIMNQKRDEIERFLDRDLLPQVKDQFAKYRDVQSDDKKKELAELEKTLKKVNVDPETNEEFIRLRDEVKSAGDEEALANEVFSHLATFFRRYYDSGDFLSLRRYKKDTYAIPYEGEEVKLYWANHDQYYIKSSEFLRDFTFKLSDSKRVHFKLVNATQEKDNVKEASGKERRFKLHEDDPIVIEGNELFLQFVFVSDKETQKKLNEQTVKAIQQQSGKLANFMDIFRKAPTEKNPNRTLLEKHLNTYTARFNFDFFIHKDLAGFFKRELDFYIKNEVLFVDDLDDQDINKLKSAVAKVKVIKVIAHKIITMLGQLEDFQKKLWLKKKFVTQCGYCVTLDRVPEELYETIAKNDAQIEEWIRLYAINEIEGDLAQIAFSEPLTVEFLKANPFLMLDTKHFDEQFNQKLLTSFDSLDEQCDGLIINSENFQALNLLQGKYQEQIKCIYIDPPYNTEEDRNTGKFLYKDSYEHASWITLINDRANQSKSLLKKNGLVFASLDENEAYSYTMIMKNLFGEKNFKANIIWNSRKSKQNDIDVSLSHNHTLIFSMENRKDELFGLPLNEHEFENPDNHPRGKWKTCPLDAPGIRERTSFFKIKNLNTGKEYLPPKGRHWVVFEEDASRLINSGDIWFGHSGNGRPQGRRYWNEVKEDSKSVGTIWDDLGTATDGTRELESIFGQKLFETVKPCDFIQRIGSLTTRDNDILLDYFAGSGTTAHAVINLNREDGGKRKYILVEMGQYFDTVLKPRIQKVVYSKDWKNGKPVSREGSSHMFKYMKLESYEDALDNLLLKRDSKQSELLETHAQAREDYMLKYMLDVEARGSASLLNIDSFVDPFNYTLKIREDDELKNTKIDLAETFNYLIGLYVSHVDWIKGFLVIQGKLRTGEKALVIWRNCKDKSNDDLDAFFKSQAFNTKDFEFDLIFVNGDNNLQNLKKDDEKFKVRLIEEEFHKRMFDVRDV